MENNTASDVEMPQGNMMEIIEEDDEMWNIDDATDSDDDTIGNGIKVFSSLSDALKENNSTKRKMLVAVRKSSKSKSKSDSFKTFPINKEFITQEEKKESNFPAVKSTHLQDSNDTSIENIEKELSPDIDILTKNFSNMFEKERKVLATGSKSPNSIHLSDSSDSFEPFIGYKEIAAKEMIKLRTIEEELVKQELKTEPNIPAKKKKHNQNTEKPNCKCIENKLDRNLMCIEHLLLQLEIEARSKFGKVGNKTIKDQEAHKLNETPLNCFGSSENRFNCTNVPPNLTDFSKPSSSTNLSNPTCSTGSFGSSKSHNTPTSLDESSIVSDLDTRSLGYFYNKVILDDFPALKEMSEEIIEVSPLDECILIKELSKQTSLDNSDADSESDYSDSFVEDPDIVNPDILYNINLNEYYTQMELLVQKISETPDDQTVFAECLQLPPIPENEVEPQTFTEKEYYNFANGISEYEYEIDSDDWNKIMVKRAVVFTAHAGFTIANEESLYVLADVAIDYIKKLAVVMKNNFDIQENSSYPDLIDPIDNSLLQIGVNGGIAELIRHYENDVFGRRDKLIKKCQHLHKIIDQYTERMLAINTKTQNSSKDDFIQENATNEKDIVEEETTLKEEKTEMENISIIDDVQTEMLSTIEEVEIETQSMSVENALVNIQVEHTESVCIDNTDCEIRMETNDNNKSEPMDSCDINIEHEDTVNNKTMDVDTSKHLVVKPDCTSLKDMCAKDLTSLETTDLVNKCEYPQLQCSDSNNSSSNTKKNKILLDFDTIKKWLEQFYPQEVEPEPDPAKESQIIRKRLKEHETEFAALLQRYASYNNSLSTSSTDSDNKLTPPQTVIVNQKSEKDEASSLNTISTSNCFYSGDC